MGPEAAWLRVAQRFSLLGASSGLASPALSRAEDMAGSGISLELHRSTGTDPQSQSGPGSGKNQLGGCR